MSGGGEGEKKGAEEGERASVADVNESGVSISI